LSKGRSPRAEGAWRAGFNAGHRTNPNRLIAIHASGAESLLDSLQHAGYVGENFTVPEANYLVAMLLDQLCAPCILRGAVEMLSAVELNYQSRLRASEVRDEVADGKLSAETEIGKSSGSKTCPEFLFGVGRVVTQLASAVVG
jgi:hypothetical protein